MSVKNAVYTYSQHFCSISLSDYFLTCFSICGRHDNGKSIQGCTIISISLISTVNDADAYFVNSNPTTHPPLMQLLQTARQAYLNTLTATKHCRANILRRGAHHQCQSSVLVSYVDTVAQLPHQCFTAYLVEWEISCGECWNSNEMQGFTQAFKSGVKYQL